MGAKRSVVLGAERSAVLGAKRSVVLGAKRSAVLGAKRSVVLGAKRSVVLGAGRWASVLGFVPDDRCPDWSGPVEAWAVVTSPPAMMAVVARVAAALRVVMSAMGRLLDGSGLDGSGAT
ncbi:hypothetical protein GCM10009638_21490 [Luteococcus sanguinis]